MSMLDAFVLMVCLAIVMSALLAVLLEDLLSAMITAGLASLFASVCYVLLAAPDVAMAEAAIGSGLSTLLILYTIRRIGRTKD
jgi:energy-converting hydrogenase B subunit D